MLYIQINKETFILYKEIEGDKRDVYIPNSRSIHLMHSFFFIFISYI